MVVLYIQFKITHDNDVLSVDFFSALYRKSSCTKATTDSLKDLNCAVALLLILIEFLV